MKRKTLSLAISLALFASLLPSNNLYAMSDGNKSDNSNKKKRYIVVFKDNSVISSVKKYNKKAKDLEKAVFSRQQSSIKKVEKITKNKIKNKTAFILNSCSINATPKQIEKIEKLENVKECYIANEYNVATSVSPQTEELPKVINDLNLPLDGEGTIISVIDSGFDSYHKDFYLDENVKTKLSKSDAKKAIKEFGYGYYISNKVPFSYDYINNCEVDSFSDSNHGTHVAGIAGANSTDSDGIKGIANKAQLLTMKISDSKTKTTYTDVIIKAIEDSVKLNSDVINMSIGLSQNTSSSKDELLVQAIDKAYESGCTVCAAAGNDRTSTSPLVKTTYGNPFGTPDCSTITEPAIADNAFTVASCNTSDLNKKPAPTMSIFSSWGPGNDLTLKPEITAPGDYIYSTSTNDLYEIQSGTSMASPYIAGVSALVKDSCKLNDINLSGKELSTFIKNNIMNTASPLLDYTFNNGETPYSVRYQGSGLVNAKNAISNTVTATYKNKAAIEIGQINDNRKNIPFSITLTNYGKTDKSYSFNDCNLYTDISTEPEYKSGIWINKYYIDTIKDSYVTFADKSVCVKAGESATVNGTIILSDYISAGKYFEGFIKIDGEIPLNMPLLGFYGDWDMLPIFDYPKSNPDSLMNKLDFGESTYFTDKRGKKLSTTYDINLDESAISHNKNTDNDMAIPYLTRIRNINEAKVAILDSNGNTIRKIGTYRNLPRGIFSHSTTAKAKPIENRSGRMAYWDGTIYNDKTGEFENAKDGQYYIEIQANISDKSPYQITTMPLYIDSIIPELDVKYEYNSELSELYIDIKANDNFALKQDIKCTLNNRTFNINYNNLETLDKGYKRFTYDGVSSVYYLEVTAQDSAQNTNSKVLCGETNTGNVISGLTPTIQPTNFGPAVEILPADINSTENNYFYNQNNKETVYCAMTINDNESTSFKINLEYKPAGLEYCLCQLSKNGRYDNETTINREITKISDTQYKITITPEDFDKCWESYDSPTVKYYEGLLLAYDYKDNITKIKIKLYKSQDELDFRYYLNENKPEPISTDYKSHYHITNDMLNEDGTFPFKATVTGYELAKATINNNDAIITPDPDNDRLNYPLRKYNIQSNIKIKKGINKVKIVLHEDLNGKIWPTYRQFFSYFEYNGEGATFDIDTANEIENDIYLCDSDIFSYCIVIDSAFNSFDLIVNGEAIQTYSDIIYNKEYNPIIIPVIYEIKGDYVNHILIETHDLCGNRIKKTIKVKRSIPTENTTKTDIGKDTVKILGIENYSGNQKKSFKNIPKKSRILKISKNRKGKVTIKAKKIKGKVKYEFFYSTNKKGKFKKLGTSNNPIFVTRKLKKNKKYFIKVRTYKFVGKKKITSKFSKVKKIKI